MEILLKSIAKKKFTYYNFYKLDLVTEHGEVFPVIYLIIGGKRLKRIIH